MNETEIWKDIEGYEGYYQVSQFGNVRSFYSNRPKLLSLITTSHGYVVVNLFKNKKIKQVFVHRLVAESFISNTENKPFINHIDFNTKNNHISNLEWCTQSENIKHSYNHGRIKKQRYYLGKFNDENPHSKKIAQYDLKGNFIQTYPNAREAMRQTGIGYKLISRVVRGERKHTCGYKWAFV